MAAGLFYWLAPRLWDRKLHSTSLANMHFWLGLVGILLYVAAMWVSGIAQGLMLSATKESGSVLAYPNFIEAVTSTKPLMHIRALGGLMYLVGWGMLAWNIFKTAWGAKPVNGTVEVFIEEKIAGTKGDADGGLFSAPVVYTLLLIVFALGWGALPGVWGGLSLVGVVASVLFGFLHYQETGGSWSDWYEALLKHSLPFSILTALAIIIGGIVQIIPTIIINKAENIEGIRQIPYTPLELAGRDIYVREGCYNCHSQQIRTLVGDVLRYGGYSKLGESIYDHPFQWGSKRTGPDLAREGTRYNNLWHYKHMRDPRELSPGSTMPNYPWLYTLKTDVDSLESKLNVQRIVGVPMPAMTKEEIKAAVETQSKMIVADLTQSGAAIDSDREIIAVIAYLQKLGKASEVIGPDGKTVAPKTAAK